MQHNPEKSEAEQAVEKVLEVMESDELGREEEGQGEVSGGGPQPTAGGARVSFSRNTTRYEQNLPQTRQLQATTDHYRTLRITTYH